MKNVIIRLWPSEPIPKSYFGLVRRLVDAVPRIDAAKRSACIEGARMAFARVKTFWGKMKAIDVAEGYATEKLFWSQFGASKRPPFLNEQMSQWAELHRILATP